MTSKGTNGFSSAAIPDMEEFAAMPYSFRTYHKVETSSTIFRLNYGATALILIAASLAVTMKQFGGRPIECVVDKDLNVDVVNNFCWIHATFSSWKLNGNLTDGRHDLSEGNIDRDAIFMIDDYGFKMVKAGDLETGPPGASDKMAKYTHGILHSSGPYPGVETTTNESFLRYHKYVQWVAGILVLQVQAQQKSGPKALMFDRFFFNRQMALHYIHNAISSFFQLILYKYYTAFHKLNVSKYTTAKI